MRNECINAKLVESTKEFSRSPALDPARVDRRRGARVDRGPDPS